MTHFGEDTEKRGPLYTIGGVVNWYSHYEKQYEVYTHKNLEI